MADAVQSLSEFTTSLLSDLESGAITAQEAVSAAQQYPYLREELASQDTILSESLVESEDAFTTALTNVLLRIQTKLVELPNFQSQQPDKPVEEQEIRDTALLRTHAIHRVKEALHPTTGKADTRRAFIHNLVTKYSAFVPGVDEKTITSAVDKSLISASKEAGVRIDERFPELLTASLDAGGITPPKNHADEIRASVTAVTHENAVYLSDAAQRYQREGRVFSALFDALDCTRPDVLVDVALNAPSSEPIQDTLLRADRLARAAQILETSKGARGGRITFFSADGARGIAGGLQKGADGILSIIGEPVRDMILHEKVNGTLRSMLTSAQTFTDRLGENFVHSALFTHISQDLTKQLADKPRSGAARSLFDDVFSSVFRGPLDPVLQKNTKGRILDFFELSRANAAAPKNKRFLPPGTLPWDAFRTPAELASSYGFSGRRGFSWFPALGFGFFGNALGSLFSSIIDRTTAFLFSSPRIPGQLSSSRRAAAIPTLLKDDMPLMVALTVIIVILLLFILPTPFNISQLSHSSKVSALFASLKNIKQDLNNTLISNIQATTFTCSWTGDSPVAQITTCPVHAPITQLPFNKGGSHKNLNAYDFGASQGTPVVSSHDAYVVSYVNSYAPYQYKYASYGNNVILVATDPATKTQYCTNYAHLLDVSPEVMSSAGKPTLIRAGTTIGWVDTTGYTYGCIGGKCGEGYGTHLHWGYNQSTTLRLPPGCP